MKVLFFTQSLGRTGSEMMLYNLICNANRGEFRMAVAAAAEGELMSRLPPDVPRSVYNRAGATGLLRRAGRRAARALSGRAEEWLAGFAREYEGYVWYINGLVQPYVLRQARKFGVECVVHSHEMEHMLWEVEEEDARNIVEYPRLVVACSDATADVLRRLGRRSALEICPEAVELRDVVSSAEGARAVRRRLNVDDGTFLWAMSGSLDPNKNPLAFVDAAREMARRGAGGHFMWLGGGGGRGYRPYVEGRSELLGLGGRVSWVGARRDDYYDHLNAADGFVLTSFRDSFPLVMIEAAALGKPIVSFNSGGVREFVRPGMGVVIDSWNTPDLCDALAAVMSGGTPFDPAVARARAAEFDVRAQVKRWEEMMRAHFGAAPPARAVPRRPGG